MSVTLHLDADRRVYLGNVAWSTYVALAESAENPRGRLAYDQGVLEIMSPSALHESIKKLIGRMIEMWTLERSLEVRSLSSTTFQRPDLQKGVEADECYYLGAAEAVRGVQAIDLSIHPPPDLVVEIDISRSSRIKLPIYAAIGVTEVWRYDGEQIHILVRQNSDLVAVPESHVLHSFPMEAARRLLAQHHTMGETELLREFQRIIKGGGQGSAQ